LVLLHIQHKQRKERNNLKRQGKCQYGIGEEIESDKPLAPEPEAYVENEPFFCDGYIEDEDEDDDNNDESKKMKIIMNNCAWCLINGWYLM
jgi:hypothetical protein